MLPMQWEWVQPLVRELRFYIPCSEAKKEIKYEKKINNIFLKGILHSRRAMRWAWEVGLMALWSNIQVGVAQLSHGLHKPFKSCMQRIGRILPPRERICSQQHWSKVSSG